jgi:hypothetical protein
MPATWSFDEMKRLSTLDTLKTEGADKSGPTKGEGLYQHSKELNSEKFSKARSEMDDYRKQVTEMLRKQALPRSGAAMNANQARDVSPSALPSPPPIPSPEEINDDLSHYVTFKHPWGNRLRNPAILFLMLIAFSIATLVSLRAKDIR